MFARVHKSLEVKGGNSGSCFKLAKYLDKEAERENVKGDTVAERETSSRLVHYLDKEEGNNFFSSQPGKFDMGEVMTNIDGNVKNLRKDDTKFYMLTLNPSVQEQKHLIGKDIDDFNLLSKEEQDAVKQKLVQFTRDSMDAYARNFHREGINSGDDLLYYARIETQRTFKKDSEEVRNGDAKAGTVKSGLNLHVHIIVSRNSKDQKRKLSPHAKSKGNSWVLNGNTVNRGFDHEKWKMEVQEIFNEKFEYISKETETYKPHDKVMSGYFGEKENDKSTGRKKTNDKRAGGNLSHEDSGANKTMIPGSAEIKRKAKKEILQDNFQTERLMVGKTTMIVRMLAKPGSSMKQAIISEIRNMLNPMKEL